MSKTNWAIWAYHVGAPHVGSYIESSKGRPYRALCEVAKRMNSNGEGSRYVVKSLALLTPQQGKQQ